MSKTKRIKTAVGVANRTDPYYALGSSRVESDKFWRWGDDNLFPAALALMARRSTTHRRIINDKADYISGKGFTCDETQQPQLAAFVRCVNGRGESLRQVLGKLAFDKSLFGNAFLEAVTDTGHTFLSLYHQDASRCRVARDSKHILLHHDWTAFKPAEARTLPLYPDFEVQEDGTLRSIVHYKDYEPMFEHYGVPPYIAGFSVSAIAWKTDRWNISRLDNSFQLSGVMMLDSSVDNEAEAERILHEYEVALNTVILAEQDELTEPIRAVIASVLGLDTASLQIVNRPPTRSKPIYMKVWEARKADGLDYDPEDERQQAFLSEITKYNIRSIE